jgi:hypothetical protein
LFTVFTAFNVVFVLSSIISADGIRLFFAGLSKETKAELDSRKTVNDKGLRLILFWVDLPRVFLNLSLLVYLIGLGFLQALYWKGPYIPDVLDDTGSGLYVSSLEISSLEIANWNLDVHIFCCHRGCIHSVDNSSMDYEVSE